MQETELPFVKGQRKTKLDYRDNLPVNMTAILATAKGSDGYLLTHDGLSEFSETNGKARGGYYNERFKKHFRVSGTVLEEIAPNGTVTPIGNIPGTGICRFANSFNTQAILSDGKLFLYDNATLTEVIDPNLGFPIDITWFRGIYVLTDGETLFNTDITNEYSISPLKFTSSEFAADPIKAVARNDQNQILAFNRYSTEYFFFNGQAPAGTTPLQSIQGKTVKMGVVGTFSQTECAGVFFCLGSRRDESPTVFVFSGGQGVSIATREVEKIIAQYDESELEEVYMESRTVDRDQFVIVHFPNETLIYNHAIGQAAGYQYAWSFVKSGVDVDLPWRGKFGVFDPRNARWVYGDIQENKLGYLDQEISSQYEEQVEAVMYTPIVPIERASLDELEMETISGFAADQVTLSTSISYDGVTYGKEFWQEITDFGNYDRRFILRRLGYVADDFNFKFRVVSSDKVALSGVKIRYE